MFNKLVFAAGIFIALLLPFAGQASADTKPKFVYVTNSGQSNPSLIIKTFQVSGTATCTNFACTSPISISGSFTVGFYSTSAEAAGGSMALSDSKDLASSPLVLSNGYSTTSYLPPAVPPLTFGSPSPASNVSFNFPFSPNSVPTTYSGGMLCTVAFTTGCSATSTVVIAPADQSPSLLAITGGTALIATIQSASITVAAASTQGSNSVSGYAVDATTGALTLLPGSPFAAGSDPVALATNPSNKFVYVANHLSNNVSVFAVNSSTGALSQVTGSPFAAGTAPSAIAVDPSGKLVYVANEVSNNVSAYSTDSETGALTPVSGSPFAAGNNPISVTMDPLGRFVYVNNSNLMSDTFSTFVYNLNGATGALTQTLSPQYWGPGPLGAVIDPSGKFFLGINYFAPDWGIGSHDINAATGALTSTPYGSGDVVPGALAFNPSGKFLYVTDVEFNYVVAFSFDSTTGDLVLVPGSAEDNYGFWNVPAGPYATNDDPAAISVDPTGKFAYVANKDSNDISGFSINGTTGALTPIDGTPFAAGVGPSSLAIIGASSVPFDIFEAMVAVDEDRKTSFRAEGFFKLGAGSDGIYPLSESVELQIGSYSVTLPAGSFKEKGDREFEFEGTINNVDLKIAILHGDRKQGDAKEYVFTAEGKGSILTGVANPVTVLLAIGDDEGSAAVKADIDK